MATAVHNNSRNSTTGFAPNELLISWEPPLAVKQRSESNNQTAEEYLSNMRCNRLMAIHALNKVAYKSGVPTNQWTEGQLVWLEGKNLPLPYGTAKLAPQRHRPFKITKIISPVAAQLELLAQWNIHPVFHTSLLTPYTEMPSHGPNFTRPLPDLIDGKAEYKVKQIRSHRTWGRCRTLQYLIKWKGYPESDNTWENADQIHVPVLIKLYHQALPSTHLKARQIQLEENHSPTLSPPKTFSHPLSPPTILQESTATLVWSRTHEENIRSACSPLNPLVQSLLARRAHSTLPSPFVTFTGNPSTLQMSTANNDSSLSSLPLHAPNSSTQCCLPHLTMPLSSHLTRTPSNSHHAIAHRHPCPYHRAPSTPPSRPRTTSTMKCYVASLTGSSRPSPTKKQVPAWLRNTMKTVSDTWNKRCSITRRPSTTHLRATNSTMGRSPISTSWLGKGCTRKPSGFNSMTMVQYPGIIAAKDPTSGPTLLTSTPPQTTASILHSSHSPHGSDTCSPVPVGTSRSFRMLSLTLGIGVTPEKLPATGCSMMRSLPWQSRSRSISTIWMPPAPALHHVSPVLCSRGLRRGLPPCKTYQGKSEPCAQGGRRPLACRKVFMSAPRRWRMSRDVCGRPS
jgi:hypothetical protein